MRIMDAKGPARCRALALSIRDLQSKLDRPGSTGMSDSAEATRKSLLVTVATGSSQGNKRAVQLWIPNARLINVTVKYVEKLRAEVDDRFLAEEPGLLAQGEIFVAASECPGFVERAGLVAKRERSSNCECGGIPERRSVRVEIRFVRLSNSGDDVHASSSGEMASGKQDIAGRAVAWAVHFSRKSGVII